MRWLKDGREVTRTEYVVSGTDPGLTGGMNVFETMRTYAGRIFRLDAHLARLEGSARALGVPWPGTSLLADELQRAATGLPPELGVRILVTLDGTRLVNVTPLDMSAVEKPLRVATRVWEPPPWLDGRAKHGSRAFSEAARVSARVDEVFWVGYDGNLTEATRSSIVAVLDDRLVTPPDDGRILAGVTRAALMDAARDIGLALEERSFRKEAPFAELYASSTLKELAPVIELDGVRAPGRGPIGARLADAFHERIRRECEAVPVP